MKLTKKEKDYYRPQFAAQFVSALLGCDEHLDRMVKYAKGELGFNNPAPTYKQRLAVSNFMMEKNTKWAVKYADALLAELSK